MIYTSYYANHKRNFSKFLISISQGQPKDYNVDLHFKDIKPDWELIKIKDPIRYQELYIEQLENIGFMRIKNILIHFQEWALLKGYDDIVLLCYESLKNNWCHRIFFKNWFNEKLEAIISPTQKIEELSPFYGGIIPEDSIIKIKTSKQQRIDRNYEKPGLFL